MGCTKEFDLNLTTGGEMPLDDAIYVASEDKIFGASGAYIHKCNASTGARESSVKVAAPLVGPTRITYHAATGRLYLAGWIDPSWVDDVSLDPSDRADLFSVNPATLALTGPVGITSAIAALQGQTRPSLSGPGSVFSLGVYLYFAYRFQASGGNVYRIDPSNTVDNAAIGAGWARWTVSKIATDGTNIYWPEVDTQIIRRGTDRCDLANPDETPVAVEWTGFAYAVCGNGTLVKALTFAAGGPGSYTTFNLELIQAGVKPFRLRYNSADGLLYIPCQSTDTVIVWNPATDTGVLKTGFDGPIDCVFTATKKFAVQSGPIGLKEIT